MKPVNNVCKGRHWPSSQFAVCWLLPSTCIHCIGVCVCSRRIISMGWNHVDRDACQIEFMSKLWHVWDGSNQKPQSGIIAEWGKLWSGEEGGGAGIFCSLTNIMRFTPDKNVILLSEPHSEKIENLIGNIFFFVLTNIINIEEREC